MKNNTISGLFAQEFRFETKSDQIYPVLNQILSVIKEKISDSKFEAGIEGKCRLILTELLTNALKHSLVPQTTFGLVIDEDRIQISKSDNGMALHLPKWRRREALTWPLRKIEEQTIVIYEDDMCCLYGWLENENEIAFYTEDHPVDISARPRDLLEHFGLMILAKSSEDFIYQYDPITQTNIFRAVISLR